MSHTDALLLLLALALALGLFFAVIVALIAGANR